GTGAFTGAVTVIGGGTMGQGIATAVLLAGLATTVVDVDTAALERARATIARRMERAGAPDGTAAVARSAIASGLTLSPDLEASVAKADVVIEAVPEIIELKLDIFRRLASAARDDALLLSNTSTMSVSRLAQACGGSERVIGMHFFNPAHRMALVEIVTAETSSPATVRDALDFATTLGKDPVVVRDVPGFITSRLGLLLGTEAMRMVEEGVARAEDIDKAMRLGYGHPLGPLELADLVGLDARLNNLRSMRERSQLPQYAPPPILEQLVAEGRLGKKTRSGFYEYDADGAIITAELRP
ncbi:MAG: 3-hydroxyacyl-CoA dehydrogenase family protein, partial [Microbacteriaceae bacterium]